MATLGTFKITPDDLAKSFQKYREELLVLPLESLRDTLLKHVSVMQGIRYRETVSHLGGDFQFGNYAKDKLTDKGAEINGRVFETHHGNAVIAIDPNALAKTVFGSNIVKGDGLMDTPIVDQVSAYIVKKLWDNVARNTFTAKHDGSDNALTSKWFDGFFSIIEQDKAGTNPQAKVEISAALGNLHTGTAITNTNAVDEFKEFYWKRSATLRSQELKLFVNDEDYHAYCDDYQMRFGALPYNKEYDKRTLDGASNVEIVPLAFVPKDKMILTPQSNIFCLFNQQSEDEGFIVKPSLKNHYDVDVIANAFFGTQFASVDKDVFAVREV